ncbi:MAG: CBS domain-containing protein [Theionarchaea archaeon]|nr:CBS domain-containing protein [Theionarchaea archaeon]
MPITKSFLHEMLEEMKSSKKAEIHKEIVFPSKMRVKDIMREIHTVPEDLPIIDLLHELKEKEETCFTVRNRKGEMVGLVTESDLMKLISKPMPHTGIGGLGYKSLLPVTKNRKCIGLLGIKDLLLILRILL